MALLTLTVFAVAGCGGDGAVPVDPTSPRGEAVDACKRFVGVLPGRLDGEPERPTDPNSPFTAAFGDPAVVVRCGVPEPSELRLTSQLFSVEGVDWLPVEQDDGSYTFTTTGRAAFVEVTVPQEHQPGATFLVDLAGPVGHAVPEAEDAALP